MMLYNPYDLILIKENVVPPEHIDQLMLLTNNSTDVTQATIVDKDGQKNDKSVRDTLWYHIPEKELHELEIAISGCFKNYIAPKYNCQFKAYDPVQFLGYPVGGHYKGHNDAEAFNPETREWEATMNRDVSFLFYLNSEFGGGELEFYDLGLTIKPKKGMMIAFPSYKDFVHKVHPVTWGHRYTLVSWVATQKHLYDTISREGIPKN